VSVKTEKPSRDPILDKLTSEPEPPREEVLKKTPAGESTVATPPAGESALGDITPRRPLSLLQVLGPGLITGAADDDPSGVATYSLAGAQLGTTLVWTALLTWPLMAAVQMMCARIGMVTGYGLASALRRKFPTPVVATAALALLAANIINIGADLSGMADATEMLTGLNSHLCVILFGIGISAATVWLARTKVISRRLRRRCTSSSSSSGISRISRRSRSISLR